MATNESIIVESEKGTITTLDGGSGMGLVRFVVLLLAHPVHGHLFGGRDIGCVNKILHL